MIYTYAKLETASEEEIVALYQAGGWWDESPAARAAIPKMIRGSFCLMGARDSSGRLVGMGRAISDGCSDAYIQDVVVLKELRGKGIGAEIIRRLTDHCLQHGVTWIGLIAEPGVNPFYERLGFFPMENYVPMRYRAAK
jgi:GNAT superfamily N-acetyltransferase